MNDVQDYIGSEYPILQGLGSLDAVTIANRLSQAPELAKKLVLQAQANKTITSKGSRAEFEARLSNLDPKIQQGLLSGGKQLVEAALYFLKPSGSNTTLRMISDDDKRIAGICNLSGGKLENDEPFLLSGILLLTGVASGTNQADGKACDFGLIARNLRNGEFEFKANGKTLIPFTSNELFVTHRTVNSLVDVDGTGTGANAATAVAIGEANKVGMYKLHNPKLIRSLTPMEFNLEWGLPLDNNTWIKLVLLGTRVAVH